VRLIWASRGRTWGFCFLDRGGLKDPLQVYEEMFVGLEDKAEVWRSDGGRVAVRFPDPEGRADAAGRVIPHDFIVLGPRRLVTRIGSVESGRQEIWPGVADRFESIWQGPRPPDGS
jgi:hypothetical protein